METELNRTDAEVRQDVKDSLYGDLRVDSRAIAVDVRDGAVHLHGTVPSAPQKALSRQIAARIKGVRKVHNELAVAPLAERGDVDITADVSSALAVDSLVDEDNIEVTTVDGVAHLRGVVESYVIRRAAEQDALGVARVLDVIDEILVSPGMAHSDEDVGHAVWQEIHRNLRLPSDSVDVEVVRGVARLRGRGETVTQRWLADEIARWTPGVVDVVNELANP